jgi:hypothetical protein
MNSQFNSFQFAASQSLDKHGNTSKPNMAVRNLFAFMLYTASACLARCGLAHAPLPLQCGHAGVAPPGAAEGLIGTIHDNLK